MTTLLSSSKKRLSPLLCCAIASEIVMFKGLKGLNQENIDEMWKYDDYPPSYMRLRVIVKNTNIKWYIHNLLQIDDPIWNGDFLAGLCCCGKISWYKNEFPTLRWNNNKEVAEIVRESPFGGNYYEDKTERYCWSSVPAFCLKYSEDSMSFIAGVLALGKPVVYNGNVYASYGDVVLPYLLKWGIPLERQTLKNKYNWISPFWPAVFTRKMPPSRSKWCNFGKSAINAHRYASILSRMYVSNDMDKGTIPYLKSRRWIYKWMGTTGDTEQMWLKSGLSQLDSKIIKAIQSWSKDV